ncbi:Thioredoxin domain protein [Methanolacinia petrolearia DSM 11571]|uniref:Thioredoxin domain protein n=1 Tax=Methanolacinia petrolearia (strain DSM 11571 / OCM 486 / SEBR 4847) TaxID=679926 RepID=E1RG21_METP4|nr:thioredoxin family protein [Methanolacinia petrolearia]ADN36256.1 Thioredoxin domain protein [Methanolacinia petrolearia DSM 11571]
MSSPVTMELNDLNWENFVEKTEKPVIVMFYSEKCPHCRTIMPYFEEYAGKYHEKMRFGLLNISDAIWLSEKFGVMATPTFKFFCGGRPVQEMVGAVYPNIIEKRIAEMIEHGAECVEKSTEIKYEITGYG